MVDKRTPSVEPKDNPPLTRPDSEAITISKLEEELLSLLVGHERYGLEIIQAFKETSGGKRNLSVGTLYPTLNRLEEKQLITSRMEDRPSDDKGGARRKYFRITRLGVRVLAEADMFRQSLSQWQAAI